MARNTVRAECPPRYKRAAKGSIVDAVEPQVLESFWSEGRVAAPPLGARGGSVSVCTGHRHVVTSVGSARDCAHSPRGRDRQISTAAASCGTSDRAVTQSWSASMRW